MIGLIGKKIGMSQVFDENGKSIPVTFVKAGPCAIVQKKTLEKDGYISVQLGYDELAERKVAKPQRGHFKKHESKNYRHLKEFRLHRDEEFNPGDVLKANIFSKNETIKVTGISKGKGFQGVVKRWKFSGAEQSHGVHESFRGTGSVGQCAQPSRIFKGKKMPGQLGNAQVTVKSLKIHNVDNDNDIIVIKGCIPGHNNSIVYLSK